MATYQDAWRIVRNRIRTTPGTTLNPSVVDKPGSTVNILAAAAAELLVECDARSAARFAAVLPSTAQGTDVDRIVGDQTFGKVVRKTAAASVYAVYLAASGTVAGALAAGAVLLAGGLQYTLDQPVTFPLGTTTPQLGTFTCKTLGSAGNQPFSSISGLQNPSALFDPSISVKASPVALTAVQLADPNFGASSGGAEAELDADFRARAALYGAGLDRSVLFLAYGATTVPGVQYATAIEDVDLLGNPVGSASLYIADVNGRANLGLINRVSATLRGFRLLGQLVNISGANPTYVSIVLHLSVVAGNDGTAVRNAVSAAVQNYVNTLPPGGTLRAAGLTGAIATVPGVSFAAVDPTTVLVLSLTIPAPAPAGGVPPDIAPASPATLFKTRVDLVSFVL